MLNIKSFQGCCLFSDLSCIFQITEKEARSNLLCFTDEKYSDVIHSFNAQYYNDWIYENAV